MAIEMGKIEAVKELLKHPKIDVNRNTGVSIYYID